MGHSTSMKTNDYFEARELVDAASPQVMGCSDDSVEYLTADDSFDRSGATVLSNSEYTPTPLTTMILAETPRHMTYPNGIKLLPVNSAIPPDELLVKNCSGIQMISPVEPGFQQAVDVTPSCKNTQECCDTTSNAPVSKKGIQSQITHPNCDTICETKESLTTFSEDKSSPKDYIVAEPENSEMNRFQNVDARFESRPTFESQSPQFTELESENQIECQPGLYYCFRCDQHMCWSCASKHLFMTASAFHYVHRHGTDVDYSQWTDESPSYCKHHNKECRLLCYQCMKSCCIGCLTEHQGHHCGTVDNLGICAEFKIFQEKYIRPRAEAIKSRVRQSVARELNPPPVTSGKSKKKKKKAGSVALINNELMIDRNYEFRNESILDNIGAQLTQVELFSSKLDSLQVWAWLGCVRMLLQESSPGQIFVIKPWMRYGKPKICRCNPPMMQPPDDAIPRRCNPRRRR